MSIKSLIMDKVDDYIRENDKDPEVIYLDPYYLSLLADELGYSEEDVMMNKVLETFGGYSLQMIEDETEDVVRVM